jgi:carbamoyl-phosphate synthase small subunit
LDSANKPSASPKFSVIAYDFGIKWNLLRSLESRGCKVEVVPANTTAEAVLAKKPNGVFLSNGPGDPAAAPYASDAVKKLLGKVPIFGVCMGHQILAIALGGKTYKMKFGHRGGNQPVLNQDSHRVEISSQNHPHQFKR